jgi:hypothetical protein
MFNLVSAGLSVFVRTGDFEGDGFFVISVWGFTSSSLGTIRGSASVGFHPLPEVPRVDISLDEILDMFVVLVDAPWRKKTQLFEENRLPKSNRLPIFIEVWNFVMFCARRHRVIHTVLQ